MADDGSKIDSVQLAVRVEDGAAPSSKSSTEGSKKNANKPKMLSASQLSDLFRRLDTDNSGSLDLEEFKKVAAFLGLKVDTKELKRIYNESDDALKSGTGANSLSLREFQTAYTKLYLSATKNSLKSDGSQNEGESVRALRYGKADGSFFVEEYVGTTNSAKNKWQKTTWTASPSASSFDKPGQKVETTLEKLKALADAEIPGVYWWFDVAMQDVSDDSARAAISDTFDLPNDPVISGNYNSFGSLLNKDPRYRLGLGVGEVENSPSLHLFVQALWIKGRPLRYLLPVWLDFPTQGEDWWTKNVTAPLKDYYSTRIAWMFSSSGGTSSHERMELHTALESANSLAKRIAVPIPMPINPTPKELEEFEKFKEDAQAHFKRNYAVEVPSVTERNGDPPTWLLPTSELKKHPPQVQYANLGMHLLFGKTASAEERETKAPGILLTIRQLERDDPSKRGTISDFELASRSGIIGRILSGVRCRIHHLIVTQQTAHPEGSIADHLIGLATLITAAVNNFSMDTMGSINEWLSVLEDDSIDLPVSKHTEHCRSVNAIMTVVNDALTPTLNIISDLKERVKAAEAELAASAPASSTKSLRRRSSVGVGGSSNVVAVKDVTADEIRVFLGDKPVESFFDKLLDGNEDFKGLNYWSKRQEEFGLKADQTKAQVLDALEEKRAFYGYVLAIATVFLSPASVLTGYFGMNFTNMVELDPATYPATPGVNLLWVIGGITYGVLLLATIHWRVLYSTT